MCQKNLIPSYLVKFKETPKFGSMAELQSSLLALLSSNFSKKNLLTAFTLPSNSLFVEQFMAKTWNKKLELVGVENKKKF